MDRLPFSSPNRPLVAPEPPLPYWRQEMLDAVGRVVRRTQGVDVSRFEAAFLAKAVERRRRETGCVTEDAYLERLAGEPEEAVRLRDGLSVGYSEFFRNPLTFAVLEQVVLPGLVADTGRSEARVWSAGCAGGQEAYSVAILLEELSEERGTKGTYRIFATDICEEGLELGRAGCYGEAAMANVRRRHWERWFTRQGSRFAVAPPLREQVSFSRYDLLDGETSYPPASIYGGFDLVLCCNVLLYYGTDAQREILAKLRRSLAPGGVLVTGEAEQAIVEQAGGFRGVMPFPAVFRKG